jgi:hypothetical protein
VGSVPSETLVITLSASQQTNDMSLEGLAESRLATVHRTGLYNVMERTRPRCNASDPNIVGAQETGRLKALLAPIAADIRAVDAVIRSSSGPTFADQYGCQYIIGAGGKRYARRSFCWWRVRLAIGAALCCWPLSSGSFTATLLHDDVVDESDHARPRDGDAVSAMPQRLRGLRLSPSFR